MRILSGILPGTIGLAKSIKPLSHEAQTRLKWFTFYHSHNQNARLTCRHFNISPQTFYRWKSRYQPAKPQSLEAHSCRPKQVRQPTYSSELVEAVRRLREQYPRWGKDKLVCLLEKEGYAVSASTIGRIISRLKARGLIKEPLPNYISRRKRAPKRPYAKRKPHDYPVQEKGDLVEIDTLDVRPFPGVIFKHFTAHDVISRWNVIGVYTQASANTAGQFLDHLIHRMPFPVKAIQVDGGSEFKAFFELACQQRQIQLFILPPRSPKLNGGVERAHRTHTEEFYEVTDSSFDLAEIRDQLLEWERVYNNIRPHQALGYLTPQEFINQQKELKCH